MRSSARGYFRVLGMLSLVAATTLGCADASWEGTQRTNTVAAYTRFLRDNPESQHARDAEERIAFLREYNIPEPVTGGTGAPVNPVAIK